MTLLNFPRQCLLRHVSLHSSVDRLKDKNDMKRSIETSTNSYIVEESGVNQKRRKSLHIGNISISFDVSRTITDSIQSESPACN